MPAVQRKFRLAFRNCAMDTVEAAIVQSPMNTVFHPMQTAIGENIVAYFLSFLQINIHSQRELLQLQRRPKDAELRLFQRKYGRKPHWKIIGGSHYRTLKTTNNPIAVRVKYFFLF